MTTRDRLAAGLLALLMLLALCGYRAVLQSEQYARSGVDMSAWECFFRVWPGEKEKGIKE